MNEMELPAEYEWALQLVSFCNRTGRALPTRLFEGRTRRLLEGMLSDWRNLPGAWCWEIQLEENGECSPE